MARVKCQLSKKGDELTDIDWSSGFKNRMFGDKVTADLHAPHY